MVFTTEWSKPCITGQMAQWLTYPQGQNEISIFSAEINVLCFSKLPVTQMSTYVYDICRPSYSSGLNKNAAALADLFSSPIYICTKL